MFHDIMPIKVTPGKSIFQTIEIFYNFYTWFSTDSSSEPCVFLIWPVTLVHEIDEESPFYQ